MTEEEAFSEGVDGAINAALSERAGESQYQSAVLAPRGAIQPPECDEKKGGRGEIRQSFPLEDRSLSYSSGEFKSAQNKTGGKI